MDCPEHYVENGEIIIPGYEDYEYLTLEQIENFTDEEKEMEYAKCAVNPLYFIENYIWIFHPLYGKVPLRFYNFQRNFVKSMWCNKDTLCFYSRQLGKCSTFSTKIKHNEDDVEIGSLIKNKSKKERFVDWLENKMLYFRSKY